MRLASSRWLIAVVGAGVLAAPARAQRILPLEDVLAVTAFAGGAAVGDLQVDELRVRRFDPATGELTSDRTVRRAIAVDPGGAVGGAATYWWTRNWGTRVHVAGTRTRLVAEIEEEMDEVAVAEDVAERLTGDVGHLDTWLFDATALFRVPDAAGRITPYGLLGIGAVGHRAREPTDPTGPVVRRTFDDGFGGTRLAGVVGVGGYLPVFGEWITVAAEVTNHVSDTPLDRAAPDTLARDPDLLITVEPRPNGPLGNSDVDIVNHFRFVAGVTMSFRIRR